MEKIIARWVVELLCDCPKCEESVDLLDYADFWETHSGHLEIAEHGTEATIDMEVVCPLCGHEFNVTCEY